MPKPRQAGGVPIWVSGRCNPPVARRLARFGSGWIPWGEDAADPAGSIPRMRQAVDAAGGRSASLAVLAPLVLRRRPDGSLDLDASTDGLPSLIDAGVTDVLVHVPVPESYAGAFAAYSELVTCFKAATRR
jgi:alkanesulfonate monooxygenase SsuD/methylene tetrahydromethanopterin reductase-like flavin-dependent oxidoreductase (luciferase family)